MMGKEAPPSTQAVLYACPEWGMNQVLMISAGGDGYHGRTEDSVKMRMCPNKAISKLRGTVCLQGSRWPLGAWENPESFSQAPTQNS